MAEADLSLSDEQLTQRRLVKGVSSSSSKATSDEREEDAKDVESLLTTVLRACLTFAGKKLSGRFQTVIAKVRGFHGNRYKAPGQATSWCTCALDILFNAPEAIALSSSVYDVLRAQCIRFPRLGSMMLATAHRGEEKYVVGGKSFMLPFITLAVISSKNCDGDVVRVAVGKLATYVGRLSFEEVRALVKMLDEHARRDLMEVCVARQGGLMTKTLPALLEEWPACRFIALNLAAAGLLHGSFSTWIDVLELVGECRRNSHGVLSAEEEQSVMMVIRNLPRFASTQTLRSSFRVARAVTRIAVASSSCEVALMEAARDLMTERGLAPACGMFIASLMLRCGGHNAHFGEATALLEAGVSHSDDFIKCVAFELVAEITDEPQDADITAWSRTISSAAASVAATAVDELSMDEGGQYATPRLLAALPGAVRLVLVDMHRSTSELGKHAALLRSLLTTVTRVEDLTSTHLENNRERLLTLRSLLEIMLDEAVRFPDSMKWQHSASETQPTEVERQGMEDMDPAVLDVSPRRLVELHRRIDSILNDSGASVLSHSTLTPLCRARIHGCAKLLDVASRATSSFTAENKMHIVYLSARCLKDLSSASNHCFENDVQSAVRECARYAMCTWRAWRAAAAFSSVGDNLNLCAEVPLALELLRECITVTSAHGDLDKVRKLIVQVTAEDERVRASVAVAKRTNAAAVNTIHAAGRAARHSPICGITAMFGDAFYHQVNDTDFDDTADEIAASTLKVMRALIPVSSDDALGDAAFVIEASMNVVRDALFHVHRMKSAHAVNTMQLLVEHYTRVDTLPERVSSLAHILFEAAPHVADGNLLDASRVLLTNMEAELAVLFKEGYARSSENEVLSDASTALHKTLHAVHVYFDSGGAMDESIGMPAFAVLALKAARHCLDVIHNLPPDSDELSAVITAGAKLTRSIEMLMRNQIIPQRVQTALEPWRQELFFHSVRMAESLSFDAKGRPQQKVRGLKGFLSAKGDEYLEELLELKTSLASKVDWVDQWPSRPVIPPVPKPPADGVSTEVKPSGGDFLGEPAKTASVLDTCAASEAERVPQKRKRRKRDKNPFVEALKASEGGKGGTAEEYDDLEDFIVCKPGRDYKRLLGL